MRRGHLQNGQASWSDQAVELEKECFRSLLGRHCVRRLASLMDNSPAFVVVDECALELGLAHVPVPSFFTADQRNHALRSFGARFLIVDAELERLTPGVVVDRVELFGRSLLLKEQSVAEVDLPEGTARVSFTSGSTGRPKGVCLSEQALRATATALIETTADLGLRRHLSVLPFALLLENVAGLIAPRMRGGIDCVIPPLGELGLTGSSTFDVAKFDAAVRRFAPDSLILLPQMLKAWCAFLSHVERRAPPELRFVAVGGAHVGKQLIGRARELGIPACEGYGLTEAGSVVTLNLPDRDRAGSVGSPLPHVELRISDQGEVEVRTPGFLGYVGQERDPADWWSTGDLGRIDDQGFVHLSGRRTNLLITGFGRNVSPEWIEAVLRADPVIRDAVVLGDGEAALWAVVWAAPGVIDPGVINASIARANASLPDYARIPEWVPARAPLDAESGLATGNGRPIRAAILARHRDGPPRVSLQPAAASAEAFTH
jgi:long-chain acyl-CoA synthetase